MAPKNNVSLALHKLIDFNAPGKLEDRVLIREMVISKIWLYLFIQQFVHVMLAADEQDADAVKPKYLQLLHWW